MKRCAYLLISICFPVILAAQQSPEDQAMTSGEPFVPRDKLHRTIDSLNRVLKSNVHDIVRVNALIGMAALIFPLHAFFETKLKKRLK